MYNDQSSVEKGGTTAEPKGGTRGGTTGIEKGGKKGGTKVQLTKRQRELYHLSHNDNTLSIDSAAAILKINASVTRKYFDALLAKGIIRHMVALFSR